MKKFLLLVVAFSLISAMPRMASAQEATGTHTFFDVEITKVLQISSTGVTVVELELGDPWVLDKVGLEVLSPVLINHPDQQDEHKDRLDIANALMLSARNYMGAIVKAEPGQPYYATIIVRKDRTEMTPPSTAIAPELAPTLHEDVRIVWFDGAKFYMELPDGSVVGPVLYHHYKQTFDNLAGALLQLAEMGQGGHLHIRTQLGYVGAIQVNRSEFADPWILPY